MSLPPERSRPAADPRPALQDEADALFDALMRSDVDGARRELARFSAAVAQADGEVGAARLVCYGLLRAAARLSGEEVDERLDWRLVDRLGQPADAPTLARRFESAFGEHLERLAASAPPAPLAVRARVLIDRRADRPLSLSRIARELGVSPSYLSSRFSRAVGKTVTRYIHERRIGRAEQLLRTTSLTLNEVARRCGFRSYRHFHRTFVRLRGLPPARYRRTLVGPPAAGAGRSGPRAAR